MPPKGHASLEILLIQLEKEFFTNELDHSLQSILSAKEWKALRNLASDRSIVIKGSSVVNEHLNDERVYKKVNFNKNILTGFVEKSNKIFNRFCSHRLVSKSELKYLT